MESNKHLFWNNAKFWGLIIGGATIVNTLIFYFADSFSSTYKGLIETAIYVTCIYFGAKAYLKVIKSNDPFPYSKALGLGVATMFFASILFALFFFILTKYMSPTLLDNLLVELEDNYLKAGLSDDLVEQQVSLMKIFMTPYIMSLGQIFNLTFTGLILSLITSIFTKKKDVDPFKSAMSGIDDEE